MCMMWQGRSLGSVQMPGSLSSVRGPSSLGCMQGTGSSACCAEAGKLQLCGGGICCRDAACPVQATRSLRSVWGPSIAGMLPRLQAEAGQTGSWPPERQLAYGFRDAAQESLSCPRCCHQRGLPSEGLPDRAAESAAFCGRPRA